MYCPRCAAQNLDGVSFCRVCGTNIEAVALALAGRLDPGRITQDEAQKSGAARAGLEQRSEGLKKIARAMGLLGSSALVGAALALFSHEPDWIILWIIFAGGIACWGMISLMTGIASLIESRLILKAERATDKLVGVPARLVEDRAAMPTPSTTPELSLPPSVTEYTTRTLSKRPPQ